MYYVFLDSNHFLNRDSERIGINYKSVSFLEKADKAILEHLKEEDFSVNQLADVICLSRSQVHRKIKAITGCSTSIYIRMIRMMKAKELLFVQDLTISEIAFQVGFKSPSYFSQIFKKTFGESPTESRNGIFLNIDFEKISTLSKASHTPLPE